MVKGKNVVIVSKLSKEASPGTQIYGRRFD